MRFKDIITTDDQYFCTVARAEISYTVDQIVPAWIDMLLVLTAVDD